MATFNETRLITLPDGRDLAWTEFGTPQGAPVIAFHGSPGRGKFLAAHEAQLARDRFRVIAPDRPGYGHSAFHPDRTFRGWAEQDVVELADHLGLSRFAVFGVSSGGPNAAACARFIGDRLTGCSIVSSPAPFDPTIPDDGMNRLNRFGRRAVRLAPSVAGWAAAVLSRRVSISPERLYDLAIRDLPPPDLAVVTRGDTHAALLAEMAAPASPTAPRATVQDFTLEVSEWGFRLEDIAIPVHVWHGDQDRNVPVRNGIRIAEAIPRAELHRLPDAGHWLFYDRMLEILTAACE